jgi:bifunctional non-homologous end joining protein LigD
MFCPTAALPYSSLPEPMLARSGRLPVRGAWAYEVKWDGFRAIVSTEGPLRVRSRRGWNMTPKLDFLAELPVRAVLDGELVAFGADGKPDFLSVCERMLHRQARIPIIFMIFDVLSVEGLDVRQKPYRERRRILEELALADSQRRVSDAFDDGSALWNAVCEHELEGLVAKRLDEPYFAGARRWVKVKNRAYWRYELEREGAIRSRQGRGAPPGAHAMRAGRAAIQRS